MMKRSQTIGSFLVFGSLLLVGLMPASGSSAANYLAADPSVQMASASIGDSKPGKTIKGELVRVDGDNYYVKQEDGIVVRMHVDNTTITKARLKPKPGDNVDAKVDTAGHAISFLTDQPISH